MLLSQAGRILGRLCCAVNSRSGVVVKTEILPKAEADGSRIVVGFVAPRYPFSRKPLYWHGWHTITFGGKAWTFDARYTKQDQPDVWDRKGLCRLGISADKLVVIFPKLEMPDLAKAKSLTIGYRRGDAERQIVLSDRKRLADVLSTIEISGREQFYPEPEEGSDVIPDAKWDLRGPAVTFSMPGGELRKMVFVSYDKGEPIGHCDLADARGGSLTLENDALYRAVSELVNKAEGKSVELWRK